MAVKLATGSSRLTDAQACLLDRHRRGILRLASVLGAKSGVHPDGLMFVLADLQSHVASAIRELLPTAAPLKEAVVVPGLAMELPKWIERLAVSGPVWDCTALDTGILIIVIDEANTMAVFRLPDQ